MHTLRKFSNISPLLGNIIFKSSPINHAGPRSIAKIFTSSINKNMSDTFAKAVELSKKLPEAPGQEDLLKLYALFKQTMRRQPCKQEIKSNCFKATVGKCNTKQPGMMDFVGKAKWNAWNSLGAISQDDAKKQYIDLVKSLGADLSGTGSSTAKAEPATKDSGKYKTIVVEKTGKVFKITFNRPTKKNALTQDMYNEIVAAMKESEASDSLLTVFTGNGDFYCSGNDLGNFMVDMSDVKKLAAESKKLLLGYVGAFIDHKKPLIALVNGPAIGISVTVMGMFDLVYASDKATFHTPFSTLGQSPEGCSSLTFPQIMGIGKATEVLLFNKKLTAEEACRRGLVTEVFPASTFTAETAARVKALSELPPESVTLSRNLIRASQRDSLHKVNAIECDLLEGRWQSKECMNAIMNFFSRKSKA